MDTAIKQKIKEPLHLEILPRSLGSLIDDINQIKNKIKTDPKYTPNNFEAQFVNHVKNGTISILNNHDKATVNEIIQMLTDCQMAFYLTMNKSLTSDDMEKCFEQYLKHLNGISRTVLQDAFKNIIMKNKFFPSIADIIQECQNLKNVKYYELNIKASNLLKQLEIRLLPRTKEYFNKIRNSNKKTIIDMEYLDFIGSFYAELL